MSKAILVMNIPKRCDDCMFHYNTYDENDYFVDKCMVLKDDKYNDMTIDGYTQIYDGCPLKEIPEKQTGADFYDEYDNGYEDGWNNFRRTILGE